jgi:hypothetical protein
MGDEEMLMTHERAAPLAESMRLLRPPPPARISVTRTDENSEDITLPLDYRT